MSKADRIAKDADAERASDDAFLLKARQRFDRSREYWSAIYDPALAETEFYHGEGQWPEDIRNQRLAVGQSPRPCLTINRLPQFHNQIVNDYRQSEIGIKASPQEQDDVEVARTYAGIFRQIEKHSIAQLAYIQGLSSASIAGIGYIRATPRYASDESFDQDIFIDRVTNPFSHFPDPDAKGFFLEDSDFWFVLEKVSKDAYEDEYGDEFDETSFSGDEKYLRDWRDEKSITIAEYFYFEKKKRTRVEFQDGSTAWEDEIASEYDGKLVAEKIVRKKKVDSKVLMWCKIDGYNVLEKRRAWATPRIPIVPVWGVELWVGERRTISGITRPAMDSQRMYNYWQSAKAEMIALAPKAPYVAAEGQIEGHEDEWRNAASTPQSVLLYKPKTVDGIAVPPPQRQMYEAPVQAIIQASAQASDDIKASLGIYDATLGAKGNEVSGRAINARKAQGQTATYNYVDNLAFAIGYIGKIVGELIPKIYDTPRQLRIIGEDGKAERIKVNDPEQPQNETNKKPSPLITDIVYDLDIDTGPSYATQREETSAILTELARNFPKIFDVAGDIAVKNMSFSGAQEISERLKRTIPPEVVGDDEDDSIKVAALTKMVEQLKAALEATTKHSQELEADNAMAKLQLADKAGELAIRQQEIEIKKKEAESKLIAAAAAAQEGESSSTLINQAIESIKELNSLVQGHGDMIEALAGPEDDVPAGEAPALEAPPAAPEAPVAAPQEEPTV